MKAKHDDRIKSATFLVTLTDFTDAGELGVFIDEEQLRNLEEKMQKRGYLEGGDMAASFNMLRANDLIWSFVVNNYLLGKEPFPFDLLYWNSDATRMPQAMHSFYLRNMYQKNLLAQPCGISMKGVPVDLSAVDVPVYFLSCREDHIAPWTSTYKGAKLFGGATRFVLAASGHIAGVVNPPDGGKYNHFVNTEMPDEAADWMAEATEVGGSWWPDWQRWVSGFDKTHVPARVPGAGRLKAIEAAPGSYVTVRA
jgi:polyhydroxyalkanoate synthase